MSTTCAKILWSSKKWVCRNIFSQHVLRIGLFLIIGFFVALPLSAQSSDRKAEIDKILAIVTNDLENGLREKLDSEIASEEIVPPGEPTPIRRNWGLMVENGSLRLINDEDRSLAPNNYLTIVYEKDYQNRRWSIFAMDNQNFRREVFRVGGR